MAEKSTNSCYATGQSLHIFEASWSFDIEDGLDFLRVHLNASMRDDEAKEFTSWNAKDALERVQHHLVLLEIVEGFLRSLIRSEPFRVMTAMSLT